MLEGLAKFPERLVDRRKRRISGHDSLDRGRGIHDT